MGYRTRYSGGLGLSDIYGGVPARTSLPLEYSGVGPFGSANDCHYLRVTAGYTPAATGIRIHIGTSSGNIAVAVYADNGSGAPGTRLAASGSVASPGTGPRTISLGATLAVVPGMWLALAADNTSVTFGYAGNPGATSSVMGTGFSAIQSTAFPPPATPAGAASWRSGYIMVAV